MRWSFWARVAKRARAGEEVAEAIDGEVRRIVDAAYTHARSLLSANLPKLHNVANALLEENTQHG